MSIRVHRRASPQPSLAPYTWTHRNYFVRLPANYDPSKAYPVSMGGGGCGGDALSGNNGGLTALPNGQDEAIQIGLSYVYSGGACFEDDYVNTPDLPYFDAVLKEVESHYCVDTGKIFVDGFSSGAWETFMLGCARAGVIRGIGTAAGGLRVVRPRVLEVPGRRHDGRRDPRHHEPDWPPHHARGQRLWIGGGAR